MKWIGQHIYDLISRFRSDVYLEDISTGTIASGGNLGLDSNNKIVKATSTSHDQVTLAGTPDYITISGQEITRNAIDLAADVTGVLPSANLDSDTAHLSGTQTFTGAKTFTDTVALTGTGRITGVDTVTADTDAASKGYADRPAKFIKIIHSAFRDDIGTVGDTDGADPHYIPLHSTSEKVTNTNEESSLIAPYGGKLLALHYRTSSNTSGATATFKLIQIEKTENVSTARNTTLDTQTTTGPENSNGGSDNLRVVSFDADAAFNAGDMLAMTITHNADVTNSNTKFYITTIWEYDISTL